MQLLIANTQDAAQLLADKAQAWLEGNVQGYSASGWSPLFTDGTQFGVAWEDRLVPAYTADELASGVVQDGFGADVVVHAAVIEAGPEWTVYQEPPTEKESI